MAVAVSFADVSKTFDEVHAVQKLSMQIQQGHVFGLLGPNGAGKTTTIRMLLHILMPDSGVIEILGAPVGRASVDKLGYLPEERGLFKKMKVIDTIKFFAELKGLSGKEATPLADQWLERVDLKEWRNKRVEELSKGMQQKIQFVSTILHRPQLVILDEPFAGLDPVNTNLIKDIMLELVQAGGTIIFSTHLMEQAEKLCDSLLMLSDALGK